MDIPRIHAISGKQRTLSEGVAKNAHGDVIYTQNNLTVTKHYDYDPFGNEIDPDPNDTNPFRYCGEYFDVHSGTYYLRNRYYYPRLGRFTTEDPARDGLNWYVYCNNNPMIFVDPFGLKEVMVRYIAEKNGGMVTWNEDTRTVSITMPGFDTVEAKGRIVNGRMLVEHTWLMDTFELSEEEATHQEGDVFTTTNDAALAFALMYYDISGEEEQEYGATIETTSYNRRIAYKLVNITNSEENEGMHRMFFTKAEQSHRVGTKITDNTYSIIHTHWDSSDEYIHSFSKLDYANYSCSKIKTMYVVDPFGNIYKSVRDRREYHGYTDGKIIMSLK